MNRRLRGITLMGILVGLTVLGVLLVVLLQLFVVSHQSYVVTTNKPWVQSDAAAAVNTMAKEIRRAAICANAGGGLKDSAFGAALSNSVTVYTDGNGSFITFSVIDGELVRTDPSGSNVMVPGEATLSLRYCCAPDLNYHTVLPVEGLGWETQVSGEALKRVIAVEISLQLRRGDLVDSFHAVVRPRTSPKKVSPTS